MSEESYRLLKFVCKDALCRTPTVITSLETVVECLECGQKFDQNTLLDAVLITDHHEMEWATHQFVRRMLFSNLLPKRGPELTKVLGLSNYDCKLLSPLLTKYGMDKATGQAKLLRDMNQGEMFDCSLFGDRAFLIEPSHIPIAGYGRDVTGSMNYLSETLKIITASNAGEERLIPIHTDGDGHCLVHAISRALVGRELFWHPLRCCLKKHFENNLEKYQQLFKDFMQPEEWQAIIAESDPDFKPPEGELHGLSNMHIFGLANVLKRPIILLDSLECMKKCGDYSALFLPGFILPEDCRGKDNTLNKPICIAWSSFSHNHYIPLVGVQKRPLPVLPRELIPKVWGMPQSQVQLYIESDSNGNCIIGGNRTLSENYIQRLVNSMEVLFSEKNEIHPKLVSDAKLYLYSDNAFLSVKIEAVIERTKSAVCEGRLYRCLNCKSLSELFLDSAWFRSGGLVYNALLQTHKTFSADTCYRVPVNGLSCKYDPVNNEFIPDLTTTELEKCSYCHNMSIRRVKADGSIIYLPEDDDFDDNSMLVSSQEIPIVQDREQESAKASASYRSSDRLVIRIKWNGEVAQDSISWIEFKQLGGNCTQDSVSHFASNFAMKHFPRDSSNVTLHMHICDEIWNQVTQHASKENFQSSEVSKSTVESDMVSPKEQSSASATPEPQYVKVVSSNGQQANLILNKEGISYYKLQKWIAEEFKIPTHCQKIKWGFPPKEIVDPHNANNYILPLKHGDRLIVEADLKSDSQKNYLNSTSHNRKTDAEDLFTNHYKLDGVSAELVWKLATLKPDVFESGGSVYDELLEKHIVFDNTHVSLTYFPTKRFFHNVSSKRLELCVKPLGHFVISPDIENRIEAIKRGEHVPGFSKCSQFSGSLKESVVIRPIRKPVTSSPEDSSALVRKGPGFSVLASPKPADKMDFP